MARTGDGLARPLEIPLPGGLAGMRRRCPPRRRQDAERVGDRIPKLSNQPGANRRTRILLRSDALGPQRGAVPRQRLAAPAGRWPPFQLPLALAAQISVADAPPRISGSRRRQLAANPPGPP